MRNPYSDHNNHYLKLNGYYDVIDKKTRSSNKILICTSKQGVDLRSPFIILLRILV